MGKRSLHGALRIVNRIKIAVVAVALIFSLGLHWPILQSVAWLNMIVSYSQHDGFEKAIVKTFDGKHPCKLCHFVASGQKAEKKDAKEISLKKFDLISDLKPVELFGPEKFVPWPEFSLPGGLVFYSPPTPPPELAWNKLRGEEWSFARRIVCSR